MLKISLTSHVRVGVCISMHYGQTNLTVFGGPSPKLTQPQQHRRDLPQSPTWCSQSVFRLRPAYPGTVQPGMDVVPAQCFGLGHQLLVGGRAVKHFGRKHRGAAQHLHAPVIRRGLCCSPPRLQRLTQRPLLPRARPPSLPPFAGRWEDLRRLSCITNTRISLWTSFDGLDKAARRKHSQRSCRLYKAQAGEKGAFRRRRAWHYTTKKVLHGSVKLQLSAPVLTYNGDEDN